MAVLHAEASVPLYLQLSDVIQSQIEQGELKQGEKIPSEDQMRELYGVSRVTVRAAIERLVESGLLIKRRGKGTYVAMPAFVETMAGGSFTKSCVQNHVVPRTEVRSVGTVFASGMVAEGLAVHAGDPVHRICRVRFTDDIPVNYEVDYFRERDAFILEADMDETPVSEIIRDRTGLLAKEFKDMFDVSAANEEQSRALDCPAGTPLLVVRQVVMAEEHQILYYNEQYILSDRYKYVVSYR